jgi:2-C-methyl-D-erythritol 4-phosphate cytidylyltransferase
MLAPEQPRAVAIIVGAGRGTRFGAVNKILAPLAGRPLLAYSIDAAQHATSVDAIVVVVGSHIRARVLELVAREVWPKVAAVVEGGERRQDSVAAGLAVLPASVELVAIHDAARPLAPTALFDDCLADARAHGAAIAAIPVADTLKRVVADRVVATVPRVGLWAAQTPQAFRVEILRRGFAYADREDLEVTDEAALAEAIGVDVWVVAGTSANLKITRPADLATAEALVRARRERQEAVG